MTRTLETERLILRAVTDNDTAAIYNTWCCDPEVAKYMTWNAHKSIEDTRMVMDYWLSEYGKEDCYRWGIALKRNGELIGMIDVNGYDDDGYPMIGYCSGKRFWGNGYMTEALIAVRDLLIKEGYKELRISAVDDNKGSNRVIQKAGFEYTETRNVIHSPMKPDLVTMNYYIYRKN